MGSASTVSTWHSAAIDAEAPHPPSTAIYRVGASDLHRVRVGLTKEAKGASEGHPMRVTTTQYLDGRAARCAYAGTWSRETEVPFDVVPAMTKGKADFDRFDQAARSLARAVAPFSGAEDPSPEQMVVFLRSAENLQEWLRAIENRASKARGGIDLVTQMLGTML